MSFSAKIDGFLRLIAFRDRSADKLAFGALVWLSIITYPIVYIFVV